MSKDNEKNNENGELEPQEVLDTASENDVVEAPEQIDSDAELQDDIPADESAEDELTLLKNEAAEYLDGWQRARAEFANYKKRVERENEEARQRITSEIMLRYLNIMDDLERALENAPEQEALAEWRSGIELIYQKFCAILDSDKVEAIETEGERFDPNLHEAISYEESDEFEGGSIIAVTQRGYKIGDRVIRPAMVRVAK